MECPVCIETRDRLLKCSRCAYDVCTSCAQRFFDEHAFAPAACMQCRKAYFPSDLETVWSKSFVHKELENHRREALVRQDEGFNLVTQTVVFPYIHRYLKQIETWEARRDTLVSQEKKLGAMSWDLYKLRTTLIMWKASSGSPAELKKKVSELSQQWTALKKFVDKQTNVFRDVCNRLQLEYTRILEMSLFPGSVSAQGAGEIDKKRKYRLAPCQSEGCSGSYSAEDPKCMVCQMEHCARCAKLKHGGTCDEDDVATARFLAASTKHCPRCNTLIMKSSGCSQMMCTSCNTIFDYNTGLEMAGIVHNPHFYELSEQVRAQINEERAARGLSTHTGNPLQRRTRCDDGEEIDILCVNFHSDTFVQMLANVFRQEQTYNGKLLCGGAELHRRVVHLENVDLVEINRALMSEKLGEKGSRNIRIAMMRGAYLPIITRIRGGHPEGHTGHAWFLNRARDPPTRSAYTSTLMSMDTGRSKLVKRQELVQTAVEAAKDTLRLALLATPDERVAIFGSAFNIIHNARLKNEELKRGLQKRVRLDDDEDDDD